MWLSKLLSSFVPTSSTIICDSVTWKAECCKKKGQQEFERDFQKVTMRRRRKGGKIKIITQHDRVQKIGEKPIINSELDNMVDPIREA
ncbi:hypothetical protein H5410_050388 [Solanum commersonii]|uniref:Uncharacterized protein n=1 Tax=Solanum commersonii TaxID=4109 RepID=A0A9J5WVD1_SOLCO|nr:hypothetical protein H5410_050388 [Solanum commersonii]